jgi:hypothetical protein
MSRPIHPAVPLCLEMALTGYLAGKGLRFGALRRATWFSMRLVFAQGTSQDYVYVDVEVAGDRTLYATVDALDDALYDEAVRGIDLWARDAAKRLPAPPVATLDAELARSARPPCDHEAVQRFHLTVFSNEGHELVWCAQCGALKIDAEPWRDHPTPLGG